MSYQVAKLIARISENLPEMSEDIMQGWIENPKGLQKFLAGLTPPANGSDSAKKEALLRQVALVPIIGTQNFVLTEEVLKEANIGYAWPDFKRLFLGKKEDAVKKATIGVNRLEKDSLDAPIMAELGGRTEIALAHFIGMLKKQSKGEKGPLLTDGYANVAYIKGNDGNLWAVLAYWRSDYRYWYVGARSVARPRRWNAGYRVLSCELS